VRVPIAWGWRSHECERGTQECVRHIARWIPCFCGDCLDLIEVGRDFIPPVTCPRPPKKIVAPGICAP
jgi:hypothetical protein